MSLTYEDVAQILRMVDQEGVRELRLEHGDFSIVVRKGPPGPDANDSVGTTGAAHARASAPAQAGPPAARAATGEAGASMAAAQAATPATTSRRAPSESAVSLTAPMPGTFYRSPAPGERPFVEVGDRVKAGDVVCILDVMKLMNQLTAPCAGQVVDIVPGDAQPVTAGQPLVWIEPQR